MYYAGYLLDSDFLAALNWSSELGPINASLDIAFLVKEDNRNGSFNLGLIDDIEKLGEEVNTFFFRAKVDGEAGPLTFALGGGIRFAGYVIDNNLIGMGLINDEKYHSLAWDADLTLEFSPMELLSVSVIGQVVGFNNNFKDLTEVSADFSGMLYMVGPSINFDLASMEIPFLAGANIHYNYSGLSRDYAEGDTYLHAIGLGITHNDYFSTTLEYVYGKDAGDDFDKVFLIDFYFSY